MGLVGLILRPPVKSCELYMLFYQNASFFNKIKPANRRVGLMLVFLLEICVDKVRAGQCCHLAICVNWQARIH